MGIQPPDVKMHFRHKGSVEEIVPTRAGRGAVRTMEMDLLCKHLFYKALREYYKLRTRAGLGTVRVMEMDLSCKHSEGLEDGTEAQCMEVYTMRCVAPGHAHLRADIIHH